MPRSSLLLLLAFSALAPSAAAQGFEGTITMTLTSTSGGGQANEMSMKTATRGDRTVMTMVMGSSAGPMAGMEVRSIMDRMANTITTLTSLPPGMPLSPAMAGAKGFVMVMPLSRMSGMGGRGLDATPAIRKLRTSQTIAGMRCDDYEIAEQGSAPIRACITSALGTFTFPTPNGGTTGGRGGPAQPGWARAFGDKPAYPLKVWGTDGKVALLVTAIDKNPVPESAFAIPEGYVPMPGRGG